MGRTAAGKTTTARQIAGPLGAFYVSQSAIKRALRPSYTAKDSLDESLRDLGYLAAIAAAGALAQRPQLALVDASFHRRSRRSLLVDAASRAGAAVVFLYCKCEDESVVRARIRRRSTEEKTHDNQADSMKIFEHISKTFEEPEEAEFSNLNSAALIGIDTGRLTSDDAILFGRTNPEFVSFVNDIRAACAQAISECSASMR
jgi:predicted kinase